MFSNMWLGKGASCADEMNAHIVKTSWLHLDFSIFRPLYKKLGRDLQTLISLGEHVNKSLSKKIDCWEEEEEELAIDPITFASSSLNCRFLCIHATTRGSSSSKMASLMSLDRQLSEYKSFSLNSSQLNSISQPEQKPSNPPNFNYRNVKVRDK